VLIGITVTNAGITVKCKSRCCLRVGHSGPHLFVKTRATVLLLHECPAKPPRKRVLKMPLTHATAERLAMAAGERSARKGQRKEWNMMDLRIAWEKLLELWPGIDGQ
jgi:hypothetical protein